MGTPTEINFRKMTLADVDAAVALDEKIFGDDAWSKEFWLYEIQNESAEYIVGEINGEIVACAGVRIFLYDAEGMTLAVAEEFRERGFGKKLLAEMIRLAKIRGARYMIFDVRRSNIPALHIYQKAGFEKIGRRKFYYFDGEDALTMGAKI